MRYILLVVMVPMFSFSSAMAQEAAVPKKWKNSAELSYVQTGGDSKISTLSAKDLFNYDWDKAALEVSASGLNAKNNSSVTAEQYNASEKVSIKLSGKNYAFEKILWEKNRPSGINNRYDFDLGVGRQLLQLANDNLFAEVGGGYLTEDRIASANQSFATYRGYAKYIRTLSATANASQDFEYLGNMNDSSGYRMNAETAIIASMSTHLSLKASYQWQYTNSPVPGFQKTNTITGMAIIVNY